LAILRAGYPNRRDRCERTTDLTVQRAERERLTLQTAQRPIGHTSGSMAGLSEAEVLILTAEDAMTPPIAMAVWAAAA
jgi:hypothetical protein